MTDELRKLDYKKMKAIPFILSIVLCTILFSCGEHSEKKSNADVVITDTLQTSIDEKEKERIERRKQIEEQEFADSIRLDKVLQDALITANKNYNKDQFIANYEVSIDSIPIRVELNLDYHFSRTHPHLIVRRNEPTATYLDIYRKGENKFEKVIAHEQWLLTYVNDTIRDINGDGLNDFVVNWYGSSGCCLKAFSNVYLLREDKKAFSPNFEFINPTFSPKEKIIRGVCYGQPTETEMYKYKWNGEKVDTIEYVAYQRNENGLTGKIIISTGEGWESNYKILKILKSVPKEYRKIEGYDWFTGNFK